MMPNASSLSCKGKWLSNSTKMDSTISAIIKPTLSNSTKKNKIRLPIAKQFNKHHKSLEQKLAKIIHSTHVHVKSTKNGKIG